MRAWNRFQLFLGVPLIGIVFSAGLVGCGGGGGGGGTPSNSASYGKSYESSASGQVVDITVDTVGRFTIAAHDTATLVAGSGGQGNLASDGTFFTQSSDGTTQFSGTVATDGSAASGTVRRGGTTVFNFSGTVRPPMPGSPTSALAGTYFGTSGVSAIMLTVDVSGHASILANVNLTSGAAGLSILSDGTFSSADASTSGQLLVSASTYQVRLDKLNGTTVSSTITVVKTTRAKWTFLVYLNGANNLQSFGPLNVNQMEQVGSSGNVNMVLQWKQASCSTCGSPDWVGTRRYFLTKDSDTTKVNSQLVQDLGTSVDMGSWRTLSSFISWAQGRYPADHYALVIWNHGAGWKPTRAEMNRLGTPFPRSVSIDDSTNTEIQTWELPQALAVTPQMDCVIFDASLMQMTEVAYEIRNSTPVVVGSEESPPGEGYVYNTFLQDLVNNPNMTGAQFGAQIVNRTLDAYGSKNNLTQSAIDTSKLSTLIGKVDAFAGRLNAHIGDSHAGMVTARTTAQSYAYPDNKDLFDYAAKIKANTTPTDLQQAATEVQSAITGALIAERHGTVNGNSHGLAIYVPDPTSYLSSYSNLAFARATSWPAWLQNQPRQ